MTKTMLRLALYALGTALIGYFAFHQYTKYQRQQERGAAREAAVAKMVFDLNTMQRKHQADANWPSVLTGKTSIRFSPVMSAEVQALWLNQRPILFIGTIDDIAVEDAGIHRIVVSYGGIINEHTFLATEFRLTVRCPAQRSMDLLKHATDESRFLIEPDVAVVTKVKSLNNNQIIDAAGERKSRIEAEGSCLDLLPLSHELPSGWQAAAPQR